MASTAATAAAPARGSAAAATKSSPAGLAVTPAAGTSAYSARVPAWIGGAIRTCPITSSPDGDVVDPGADGLDDTGGVTAEHQRVLVRQHLRQHPGGYGVVEAVQPGGLHPDQDVCPR